MANFVVALDIGVCRRGRPLVHDHADFRRNLGLVLRTCGYGWHVRLDDVNSNFLFLTLSGDG